MFLLSYPLLPLGCIYEPESKSCYLPSPAGVVQQAELTAPYKFLFVGYPRCVQDTVGVKPRVTCCTVREAVSEASFVCLISEISCSSFFLFTPTVSFIRNPNTFTACCLLPL